MITKDNSNNEFDSSSLVLFIGRWFKPLLFISLAAAILSAVASLLIKDQYSSEVILFPVSTNSISRSLLSDDAASGGDILEFGEEEQAEQLLQILHSDEIRETVIRKFHLLEHYEIDTTGRFPHTELNNRFLGNVRFERTEFMSVRIEVLDEVPQVAADIANEIASLSDSVRHRIHKDRALEAFRIVEKEYLGKVAEVKRVEDSLTFLRGLGVFDFQTQTQVLTEQRAQALIKGKKDVADDIDKTFQLLAKYGAKQVALSDRLYREYVRLSTLKKMYEQMGVDLKEELPFKFVVNRAVPAEKKKYPIRWLIVVISTISAFVLSVLVVAIMDKWRLLRRGYGITS